MVWAMWSRTLPTASKMRGKMARTAASAQCTELKRRMVEFAL
jgi:hypothetical protein